MRARTIQLLALIGCMTVTQAACCQTIATISFDSGSPWEVNPGCMNGRGSFSVSSGWTATDVTLYAAFKPGPRVLFTSSNNVLDVANGIWDCTGNNLWNGDYDVWVILTIRQNGTTTYKWVTALLKTLTIKSSPIAALSFTATIDVNSCKSSGGVITSEGSFFTGTGVSMTNITTEAFPTLGGIALPQMNQTTIGQWLWSNAQIWNLQNGASYKVAAFMSVTVTGSGSYTIVSNFASP
jgi:hypothetical protein